MNSHYAGMSPTTSWLVATGAETGTVTLLLNELAHRFSDQGIELPHASLVIEALHPLIAGTHYVWTRDAGGTIEEPRFHGFVSKAGSRLQANDLASNGGELRCRLDRPVVSHEAAWLEEFRTHGATDILALLIRFSDGSTHAVAWATDRTEGFSDDEISELRAAAVLMTSPLEVIVTRQMAATLLDTYLGKRSGAQVLSGLVKRGDGESINAVVWLSDLRGFTALSEKLPPEEVLKLLNSHFERIVAPIKTFGGEVLKFTGDGLLAIFPIVDSQRAACEAALRAARSALTSMEHLNREFRQTRRTILRFGIGLHLGDVHYGNIGSPDRLDFTAIGPAVNFASRLERLCKRLNCRLVLSSIFAEKCGMETVFLGERRLRGIKEPARIFTLEEFARKSRHKSGN